jgi:NAD(P)-dependent dehydrogenase (short-subunit alcohol dehydrogenase family)
LSEQVVVITGASSGIGLATAEGAVAKGAKVVLAARNEDALNEIAERLRAQGGEVEVVAADVASEADVERVADAAISRFGRIDTWVNDAAAAVYARVMEMPVEDHRRVFDVGYWGTVYGSLAAARHLRARGGAIINVGSVLSERTMILQGAYSAMKHAVRGFTDALRMELEADGHPISVTLIKPAGMNSPYSEHARNMMDAPARIPPVVYDPRLSARAILFAAEHSKRELTVGFSGLVIAKVGSLMPRASDLGMEAIGEQIQKIDKAPPPEANDNLYVAREDGRVESEQDLYVRRTSLLLEAQMRPVLATALISGLSALAMVAARHGGRTARRERQLALDLRRPRGRTAVRREAAE